MTPWRQLTTINKECCVYALKGDMMMLRVTKYKDSQPINIENDLYTPINIEFGSWNISKEPTIYWKTEDFKKFPIKIGIMKGLCA